MLEEKLQKGLQNVLHRARFCGPLHNAQRYPSIVLGRGCRMQALNLQAPDDGSVNLVQEYLGTISTCTDPA